jgi:hypothetical protein
MMRGLRCRLTAHDDDLVLDDGGAHLECRRCGRVTAGWAIIAVRVPREWGDLDIWPAEHESANKNNPRAS